jgi:uncharacterized protein (TIGR00299 family) protein
MTCGALIDLGVPRAAIDEALGALPLEGYEVVLGHAHLSGVVATTFEVKVTGRHPERPYAAIDAMLDEAALEPRVKTLARAIFRRLADAESAVHRMPLSEVHFHEVGAVDAIVDIVGAAAALHYLGADLAASPLPMGHGLVVARHGPLPLPAPATVSCLAGVPTYGVDLEAELVTPTGAAIVATAASRFTRWPSFKPERVGYGAGRRRLADRPNMVRAVLGVPHHDAATEASHTLVEANVDDLSGELAGHALEALRAAGALDAWATPIVMKKGRPGLTLAALVPQAMAQATAAVLLRETTTIGVRMSSWGRVERPREVVSVATRFGELPIKVSGGPYGAAQVKPEFDACARAAASHGVPVRAVLEEALAAYRAAHP